MYHDKVDFLPSVNTKDILVRTSTEDRTQQVAGGLLFGMDPETAKKSWPVFTQPSGVRGIYFHPFHFFTTTSKLIRSTLCLRTTLVPMPMISGMRTSLYLRGQTTLTRMLIFRRVWTQRWGRPDSVPGQPGVSYKHVDLPTSWALIFVLY